MSVRCASSRRGRTLKQHVVLVAQSILITLKAQPLGTWDSMVINRKLIMTPHPKPNHLIDLRKPEGQAEEGVKGGIFGQGNPAMELADEQPLQCRMCEGSHRKPPNIARHGRRDAP